MCGEPRGSIPGSGSLLGAADGRHFSARGWTGLGLRHLLLNAKQLPNLFLSITELYSAKTHALRHKCRSRAARVRGLPAPRPSSSPTASGSRVWPKVKTGVPWGGRGAGPCRCLGHPAAGHGGTRCPTLCCKAGDVYLSSSETHW